MERRRSSRRTVGAEEPLSHAKLRAGAPLRIQDASSGGALVETTARLLPGRPVDAHIVTPGGRLLVRGRVARAYVCRLTAEAIRYRAALAFDQPVDVACTGGPMPAGLQTPTEVSIAQPTGATNGAEIEFIERRVA